MLECVFDVLYNLCPVPPALQSPQGQPISIDNVGVGTFHLLLRRSKDEFVVLMILARRGGSLVFSPRVHVFWSFGR